MYTPEQYAFLDMLAFAEGTSMHPHTVNNGYDVIVTGVRGLEVFTDYREHPFEHRAAQLVRRACPEFPKGLYSTASGRYQIKLGIWHAYRDHLKLSAFVPAAQDAVAVQMIREQGGWEALKVGNVRGTISTVKHLWASLPGNTDGQGGKSLNALLDVWPELLDKRKQMVSV